MAHICAFGLFQSLQTTHICAAGLWLKPSALKICTLRCGSWFILTKQNLHNGRDRVPWLLQWRNTWKTTNLYGTCHIRLQKSKGVFDKQRICQGNIYKWSTVMSPVPVFYEVFDKIVYKYMWLAWHVQWYFFWLTRTCVSCRTRCRE